MKWEYNVLDLPPGQLDAASLTVLGKQGWELVAVVPGAELVRCVFKRKVK